MHLRTGLIAIDSRRRSRTGSDPRLNMTLNRGRTAKEHHHSNDDQEDGKTLTKLKHPQFLQEEQNAKRNQDCGAHKTSDSATRALASAVWNIFVHLASLGPVARRL